MDPKWIKFKDEKEYHYSTDIISDSGCFGIVCDAGSIFGMECIDEIVNDLTHHDKCKECYKIKDELRLKKP